MWPFSEFHAIQYWNCREENIDSLVLCHCPCRRSYRLSDGGFAGNAFPKGCWDSGCGSFTIFPTISGEYRAIRSSQRFRGIGVGVVHTLTHLPSTVEYILIPLILRTTKVAEELSASMTVRGVRFSGETISYRPIHFSRKDGALCVFMVLIASAVFVLEKGGIL